MALATLCQMGTELLCPKGHKCTTPQFLTHVCCGQTAGWIKMPLGRLISLNPGDIVLDGDPTPKRGHTKGESSTHFSVHVYCGQTAGWSRMDQDATWYGMKVGLCPGDIVLDVDPAPPQKGHSPHFWLMSVVAKPLDESKCHLVRS